MKTPKALPVLLVILAMTFALACTNKAKAPDVSSSIRQALDQAGLRDVSVSQDRDKNVVTLTGNVASDNERTQAESIARSIAGLEPNDKDPGFQDVIKLLGISNRLHHKPSALSGGEQQRVAIARAIVNNPALLLADEPTGNLDSTNSDAVLGLLRTLNESLGQTILMITHNPEAAAYGHRIAHMKDGRID